MRTIKGFVSAGVAVAFGLFASQALAQNAISTSDVAPTVQSLVAKAGASRMRVIVMLREPSGVTLGSSAASRKSYAEAVAQLQDAVLRDVLNGTRASLEEQGRGLKLMHVKAMMALSASGEEIKALSEDPRVAGVYEDKVRSPELLQSLGIIRMTGGGGGYSLGASGAGRVVAILDTGVRKNHEFLKNKVISEACYNTTSAMNGSTSRCPGGVSSSTAPGSGADCAATFAEGCGHGTHVAGIAAGKNTSHSAGEPFNGVAKSAKIVAINVFSKFSAAACSSTKPCLSAYDSDIILGLQRVFDLRTSMSPLLIDAANMSLGSFPTTIGNCDIAEAPTKAAIDALIGANVATVIAAGNDSIINAVSAPGCISSAITVSATSKRKTGKPERVAIYSNIGSMTDLFAPGGDFSYPFKTAKDQILSSSGSGYKKFAGTSMAAPHVAGAIAAIRSKVACSTKTVSQIETAFHNTGLLITDWRDVPPNPHLSSRRLSVPAVMANLGC